MGIWRTKIEQVDQVFPNVDDTNGLDPEAEFKSWKLRELKRLRRDGEVLIKLYVLKRKKRLKQED
ncbi:hypothetical protein PSTG_00830 [Puccinia striiformis f. sp. tritici PST-78]|uniref:Micro-fibrillar-associated protein 1 C-terminal domain-containing protein n=1 Tax=Puccinia striiformis f. sp. tritici PST-78 TaxID=1165861 RepID=A0A0L0W488_9BASI|nr:hypothetical protein PSTG_00830 [Puccinia striiformis f. sp. tritici PST-78]